MQSFAAVGLELDLDHVYAYTQRVPRRLSHGVQVIISAEADILSGCIIDAEVAVTDADNNTLAECVISTVGVLETFDDDFTQGITVALTASICDTPDEDQVILAVEVRQLQICSYTFVCSRQQRQSALWPPWRIPSKFGYAYPTVHSRTPPCSPTVHTRTFFAARLRREIGLTEACMRTSWRPG